MKREKALQIAILGTRGIPANYGGFETFAEELSRRLVRRGHQVVVYCRNHHVPDELSEHRGARLVRLPSVRTKYFETVSHTLLSTVHVLFQNFDVVLVCNAANAFLCWLPRLRGQKVVLNVDGIERLRDKWGRPGKAYYKLSERLATWFPQKIVTDAETIQKYYAEYYGCESRFIPYGASTEPSPTAAILDELDLKPRGYLLHVGRLEPENNAHLLVDAYVSSSISIPLVVVGDSPYSDLFKGELAKRARRGNVLLPGAIYGKGYRELLSHSLCYLHGAEVGGTHPALLEAMGVGSLVIANDTPESREVVGDAGFFCEFREVQELASLMEDVVRRSDSLNSYRSKVQERIRLHYDWDQVTDAYEELFYELVR